MLTYPFEVNDSNIRNIFLEEKFFNAVSAINKEAKALWGKMSSQHMVEHLLWSFEISTGTTEVICRIPVHMLDRMKKFLYQNSPTPFNFKNPSLGEEPPGLRFPGISEALSALESELEKFLKNYNKNPEMIFIHPLFGEINLEEWHRSHFKHCYHHLLQFNLIKKPD
jgi:hypothetical protein